MFCCLCAGSCNHVGNHTYCAMHGGPGGLGSAALYPVPNTQLERGPAFGFRFTPDQCGESHCFCRSLVKYMTGEEPRDHEECCNCGLHRLKPEMV
jgi:hypothetical protein